MASRNTDVATTANADTSEGSIVTINPRLLAQFAEMAVAIPAADDNGTENILEQIFAATKWSDLDAPWDSTDVADILGLHLRVEDVTRRPSSFRGGLGIMLVVKLYDPRTGKKYVKATGSISVVGQLAMAYFKGWTPLTIEWCRADRASDNGFYPQHLIFHDGSTPKQGSAS
jgi:hypothetical protein